MQQECLGRLIFDVTQAVQWPTFHNSGDSNLFYGSFGKGTFSQGDETIFGNARIAVLGPVNDELLGALRSEMPKASIERFKVFIREKKDEIKELKKKRLTEKILGQIADIEGRIESRRKAIDETSAMFGDFDLALPDSEGYWARDSSSADESVLYSKYRAYLKRGEYVYIFESSEKITPTMDKEKHGKQFVAMLAKFRPRKANEIPTELGVCIPHGFIADDGKTATDIKQSLRWPDAPGVLYTIHTGTVDERKMKTSLITAAGSAAVGLLGSYAESEVKPFVTERIGPRPYQIGGLKASQGGVALKISRPGKKPFEAYNVFTGYSGWLGTEALPYILVEMSTRTMEQAQELKQNPPPFQQSMGRLEILLKSTRLRPTTPLMPDLANLPKQ